MSTRYLIVIAISLLVVLGIGYLVMGTNGDSLEKNNEIQDVNSEKDENDSTVNINGAVLDLSGRGLVKVPSYVFDRTNLVELNLSNNKLDGSLQAEIRHLRNLKVLNLSNNKFTGVPAEVGQLEELEILDLSNNLLTGLPNEIGNLSKLKILDISGNNYSELDLSTIKKGLSSTTFIKTE